MNRNMLIYLHTLNISNNTLLYLADEYKNLEDLFELSKNTNFLDKIHFSQRDKLKQINIFEYEKVISKVNSCKMYKVVTIYDEIYPNILRMIQDKPAVIYVKGNYDFNNNLNVAIVGSREPSNYGEHVAKMISKALCELHLPIISGMARGIDRTAHCISLINNNPTIGVLGSGIDYVYPKDNLDIYNKIPECGAIISEYPLGTKPYSYNFPRRNRIISGLSIATIVVEANKKSGSIITASKASIQGRDVYAVPGRITDERSMGTNSLIRDGAYPIIDINSLKNDIMELMKNYIDI